mmetsp:Transcript_624/g.1463  ORF Transcript_624/g.1463 Transcript_624/m.1463 type:complete len:342 (+) Transcript_624:66-1091(+)
MARGKNRSTNDAALTVADRVLSKQTEYVQPITTSFQPRALDLAGRLAPRGGEIATALMDHAETMDASRGGDGTTTTKHADKMAAFLEGQRSHLKQFAADNVRRQRDVDAFVGAVGKIRDDIRMNRAAVTNAQLDREDEDVAGAGGDGGEEGAVAVDYENLILKDIEDRRRAASASGSGATDGEEDDEMANEALVKEMRARLGEKPAKNSRKGGTKRSAEDDADEEDEEEFEVVNDAATGHDTAAALTCPILATTYDNPVKNKVCGHTYSKAGFDHIMTRSRRGGGGAAVGCPVPGCSNDHLRPSDMKEDVEMVMRVRRFKKREERERNARMSQMDDLEEDE